VITGFIAATWEGTTTTIGRGGSDYTATIVGASIGADEVWIWTDVDGLMTTDPNIIPKAKRIPEVSFAEAIEMAVLGAKSMHPRALEPAMESDIPVRIRNTFNPENPGTLIVKQQKIEPGGIVKALNIVKDVAMITVGGAGMVGTPGTAAKIFDVLGRNGINILMISQSVSETNISIIIKKSQLKKAVFGLETVLSGKGIVREITAEGDVCIIAAIGAGMKGTPGVAAKIFDAVARRGINIRMIAQGSSELNISFVVKDAQSLEAAKVLHEEFKLS
jgi:aspartate kinase